MLNRFGIWNKFYKQTLAPPIFETESPDFRFSTSAKHTNLWKFSSPKEPLYILPSTGSLANNKLKLYELYTRTAYAQYGNRGADERSTLHWNEMTRLFEAHWHAPLVPLMN